MTDFGRFQLVRRGGFNKGFITSGVRLLAVTNLYLLVADFIF